MDLPKRKINRLVGFDYSSNHAYFITICAKDKKCIFGKIVESTKYDNIVGADIIRPKTIELSKIGKIADDAIKSIPLHYDGIFVDKYVIMPNHIYLILRISNYGGRMVSAPTVIGSFKRYVSTAAGVHVWQKSFYDHVIRDEADYLEIWQYIDGNPSKWHEDKLYIKD